MNNYSDDDTDNDNDNEHDHDHAHDVVMIMLMTFINQENRIKFSFCAARNSLRTTWFACCANVAQDGALP